MDDNEIRDYLEQMPDEVAEKIALSMPWQIESRPNSSKKTDSDGFPLSPTVSDKNYTNKDLEYLQTECWTHFCQSPPINTSVRDTVGRLTGSNFSMTSEIPEIAEAMLEIIDDSRNRLMTYLPKFIARSEVEGELFLVLTGHDDGFVEIDFRDPTTVRGSGSHFKSGILFHPSKPQMPLAYRFEYGTDGGKTSEIIPSIFVAYYPKELKPLLRSLLTKGQWKKLTKSTNRSARYKALGGFDRFVTVWDRGFLTERNISHLRTSLEWMNYYKQLKEVEIDHKKSAGSYLWVGKFQDPRFFKLWLTLTDEEKAQTGLFAKKTPGGTLILPPGLDLDCKNPQLPNISGQDNDILEMVVSGLNKTAGQVTGTASGTYASANANRAPQADRLADELEFFERFLTDDFWRPILYLRSVLNPTFSYTYTVEEVVGFKKETQKQQVPDPSYQFAEENDKKDTKKDEKKDTKKDESGEDTKPTKIPMIEKDVVVHTPVIKKVVRKAHQLLDLNFPTSEVSDFESRAKAMLGVKHGSVVDTLGIPRAEVAKRLGFGGYGALRRRHATEDAKYPGLLSTVDQESEQESKEAEPSVKKTKLVRRTKETTVLKRRKK